MSRVTGHELRESNAVVASHADPAISETSPTRNGEVAQTKESLAPGKGAQNARREPLVATATPVESKATQPGPHSGTAAVTDGVEVELGSLVH